MDRAERARTEGGRIDDAEISVTAQSQMFREINVNKLKKRRKIPVSPVARNIEERSNKERIMSVFYR